MNLKITVEHGVQCYSAVGSRQIADCGNVENDYSRAEQENHARRIAACVNACLGIPTEMLETADPERQPAIYSIQAKRIAQLELQVIALKGGEVSNAA